MKMPVTTPKELRCKPRPSMKGVPFSLKDDLIIKVMIVINVIRTIKLYRTPANEKRIIIKEIIAPTIYI